MRGKARQKIIVNSDVGQVVFDSVDDFCEKSGYNKMYLYECIKFGKRIKYDGLYWYIDYLFDGRGNRK